MSHFGANSPMIKFLRISGNFRTKTSDYFTIIIIVINAVNHNCNRKEKHLEKYFKA